MTESVRMRRAAAGDAAALTLMVRNSAAYDGIYRRLVASVTITPEQIAADDIFVAERNATIIGFYALRVHGEGAELDYLFVSDGAHGRGIGRALVEHLRGRMSARGVTRVEIVSHPPAEAFYLRMGARRTGTSAPSGNASWDRPVLTLEAASRPTAPEARGTALRGLARRLTKMVALASACLGAGCWMARHGASAREAPSVSIVDLSPRFLAVYDSASAGHLDAEARWRLWKQLDGFAAVPPTPYGDTLARRLLDAAWPRYPAAISRIRRGPGALGFAPDPLLHAVERLLGCGAGTRVRLITFVGAFDENAFASVARDGSPAIAIPIEAGDARRAAIHEFTHAVHHSRGCANIGGAYGETLGELVVSEGLAMHAVKRMIPGRADTYYIVASQAWLDSARSRRSSILRGIRPHLAESGAAQRFTTGGGTTGLSREAYFAGWVIVDELLHDGMSMHEIAVTPGSQLPQLVDRTIAATTTP